MGEHGDAAERVRVFLEKHRWISGSFTVRYLAAGEYNENYLVDSPSGPTVFRINHGTQLDLDDQIGYEYDVLRLVAPSGVTPLPLRLCRSDPVFPRGALLMTFLLGESLDYNRDLPGAAECFARIHSLPYESADGPLLVQSNPVRDILEECRGLLSRFPDHPLPDAGRTIRRYRDRVESTVGRASFDGEPLCIVNTEVNSGNFLVDAGRVRLVDWEKAVVSYRYQDLGHFLVPTTTLWKTDYRFDAQARRRFLELYHAAAAPGIGLDELDARTNVLEQTILLRAFSWVYMAYAEYASGARTLTNPDTLATIERYLTGIDGFLGTA